MAPQVTPREVLIGNAARRMEAWLPTQSIREIEIAVEQLPPEQQRWHRDWMRHAWGTTEKAAAAALGSILMEQDLQANSAVTLWPINPDTGAPFAGGASIPNNTVVALQPVSSGVSDGPYLFVHEQRFFGLLTITADTAAGWCFAAGTVKMATDAISGLAYGDTSFGLFEQDVVAGRLITGEYERHEVIEEIEFFASAILRSTEDAPMIGGVTVQFWDSRCKKDWTARNYNAWFSPGDDMIREVLAVFQGGILGRNLERIRERAR